jgi:hypothetical protein
LNPHDGCAQRFGELDVVAQGIPIVRRDPAWRFARRLDVNDIPARAACPRCKPPVRITRAASVCELIQTITVPGSAPVPAFSLPQGSGSLADFVGDRPQRQLPQRRRRAAELAEQVWCVQRGTIFT